MNTQDDAALNNELSSGFSGEPTAPAGGAEPIAPQEPSAPVSAPAEIDTKQVGSDIASAFMGALQANGAKEEVSPLDDAIKSLPADQQKMASDLKPIFEKLMPKEGLVTQDQAKQMVDDAINIQHLDAWKGKMVTEWDGENGKPKFDFDELDKFMDKKGLKDPEDAFFLLHKDKLINYRASRKPKSVIDSGGRPASPDLSDNQPANRSQAFQQAADRGSEKLANQGY